MYTWIYDWRENNVAFSKETSFIYIDIYSHWTRTSMHNVDKQTIWNMSTEDSQPLK